MHAFVINLKSREDRWEKIQRHFHNSKIKLTRIDAVKSQSNGAHGCFLSFIKAIKMAKKMGLPEILILEDDCLPVPGWRSQWRRIQKWLKSNPEKWDIYSGGAHFIFNAKQIGQEDDITYYDPAWSVAAHWLYIPERSYSMLLDYYQKVTGLTKTFSLLGIDVHNNFFKTVITCPFIAHQDSGISDIVKTVRDNKKTFTNAEASLCGRKTRKNK